MTDPRHAALFRTLTEYGITVSPASSQLVDHLLTIFDTLADHSATLNQAADAIDAETQQLKDDGVLEPDKYRPCRDAAEQLREMAKRYPPRTAQTREDILNEAADWLVKKYGVTNRAAGDLRRMAKGEI